MTRAQLDLLGVRVRQWAYFYILQDKALTLDQLAPEGQVAASERFWLSWSLWLFIPLMRKGEENRIELTPDKPTFESFVSH